MLSSRKFGLVESADHLGVETTRHFGHRGHDTLVVDDHRFDGSSHDAQFLQQMVASHRNTFAHQNLIARAAQTSQVDSLGTFLLCQRKQFRIL